MPPTRPLPGGSGSTRIILFAAVILAALFGTRAGEPVRDGLGAVVMGARRIVAPPPPCPGFGAYYPQPIGRVVELEDRIGCRLERLRWFQDWGEPFDLPLARSIVRRGAAPELSWQPQVIGRDGLPRGVPYREIASGMHDAYVLRFARDVRRLGARVSIAFAPEMNGDWGAFQLTAKNRPEHFVAAWRRLRRLFAEAGASVRWVWTPNIIYPTQTASYQELYPGDEFVDLLGLDGYNWGTTNEWNRWFEFERVFGPSLAALAALSPKPVQLAEVGSAEQGGDKAAWIRGMCQSLASFPQVVEVVWFNEIEKADWRIDSSERALEAFRGCMRSRLETAASGEAERR